MEFDVTKAMRSWSKGAPNYGLLVKVVNEAANGRDLTFYSKSHSNSRQHPFIYVTCNNEIIQEIRPLKKEGEGFTKNVTKSDKGETGHPKQGSLNQTFLALFFLQRSFCFSVSYEALKILSD